RPVRPLRPATRHRRPRRGDRTRHDRDHRPPGRRARRRAPESPLRPAQTPRVRSQAHRVPAAGAPMSTTHAAPTVAVLGSGAWGTAFAMVLADAGSDVVLWGRDPQVVRSVATDRVNPARLPGVAL